MHLDFASVVSAISMKGLPAEFWPRYPRALTRGAASASYCGQFASLNRAGYRGGQAQEARRRSAVCAGRSDKVASRVCSPQAMRGQ
eukprot:641231-Pyramimonas_sp.AAC.1